MSGDFLFPRGAGINNLVQTASGSLTDEKLISLSDPVWIPGESVFTLSDGATDS